MEQIRDAIRAAVRDGYHVWVGEGTPWVKYQDDYYLVIADNADVEQGDVIW
jgi:hypothetical protein